MEGEYIFEGGLFKNGYTQSPCIGIAFDQGHYILLKHGSPTWVLQYLEQLKKAFREGGLTVEAEDLSYLEFPNTMPVEELNKCIRTSGYLRVLVPLVHVHQGTTLYNEAMRRLCG